MRVLFDYQAFSMQRYGGVSRYVYELVSGIRERHPDITADFAGRFAQNEYLTRLGENHASSLFHSYQGRGRGTLVAVADALNARACDRRLCAGGVDVVHPTYYHTTPRRRPGSPPVVLTVHDMIHELFDDLPDGARLRALKRSAVGRADHIITASANTSKDLQRLLEVPPSKITVIHHGCSFRGNEPGSQGLALPERFVLFVGSRLGYKNFSTLVQAASPLLKADPSVHLVCAGGGAFTKRERELFERNGIAGSVLQTPADDASLAAQYRRALVYVCPSVYEGFGLPLLEAMAFGCPAASSGASSLPEVGGDAVRYFDPMSPSEMSAVLGDLITDAGARAALGAAGRERSRHFSWEASVSAHLGVYRAAMDA